MDIHWTQAEQDFQHNKVEDIAECKRLIEEVETSDFSMLDWRDVQYYAYELNRYSNRKEKYTPNEIRRMNAKANNISTYSMLHTFEDDPTDDVIDFY